MKIFGKSILGEICDTISNSRRVYCLARTFLKVFKIQSENQQTSIIKTNTNWERIISEVCHNPSP